MLLLKKANVIIDFRPSDLLISKNFKQTYNFKHLQFRWFAEIPFCHENAIEGNFGSNGISSSLLLHASYSNISDAIDTPARGTERCTCYVTALSFIDILNIGLLHYLEQSEKECTKKIDVMRDGALQATSGCSTERIELYGLRPDTTVTLTLSASNDFTLLYKELDQVMVAIAPGRTFLNTFLQRKMFYQQSQVL